MEIIAYYGKIYTYSQGEFILKLITKEQFESLEKANLLIHTKFNKNYYITSQKKKSKRHKYYIVETKKILNFLGIKK